MPEMEPRGAAVSSCVECSVVDCALFQAIDYGFLALGEIVRATIYQRLESKYQLTREEIPEKLQTFHEALRGLLGGGAKVMEKLIVKNLYSRLGLNFIEHGNWTLVEYVDHANRHLTGG